MCDGPAKMRSLTGLVRAIAGCSVVARLSRTAAVQDDSSR